MTITVTLACGHTVRSDGGVAPVCPIDGEARIANVKAPAPTFRGVVLGPCAEYQDLPAKRIELKESGR